MHITQILQSVTLSTKGNKTQLPAVAYKPMFQVSEGNHNSLNTMCLLLCPLATLLHRKPAPVVRHFRY